MAFTKAFSFNCLKEKSVYKVTKDFPLTSKAGSQNSVPPSFGHFRKLFLWQILKQNRIKPRVLRGYLTKSYLEAIHTLRNFKVQIAIVSYITFVLIKIFSGKHFIQIHHFYSKIIQKVKMHFFHNSSKHLWLVNRLVKSFSKAQIHCKSLQASYRHDIGKLPIVGRKSTEFIGISAYKP